MKDKRQKRDGGGEWGGEVSSASLHFEKILVGIGTVSLLNVAATAPLSLPKNEERQQCECGKRALQVVFSGSGRAS